MNIAIMRTFVQLRQLTAANHELARKLDELERRVVGHDEAITTIIKAIRDLATPPALPKKRRIGFITQD